MHSVRAIEKQWAAITHPRLCLEAMRDEPGWIPGQYCSPSVELVVFAAALL